MGAATGQWTLVAEFDTEPPAYIAAGMLEANGIAARVESQNMTTIYGAGATWAPVRLFVHTSEAQKAEELIADHND